MALIAAVAGTLVPLGADAFLHQDRRGRARLLPRADAFVLDRCATFQPQEQHLRALREGGMPEAVAQDALSRLRAQGLLVDFAGLLADADPAPDAAPAPAPLLVPRSWHRPDGLARLLASIRAAEVRHGAAYRVAVVDDTDDPAFAARTRELVAAHAAAARGTVALLGARERGAALARVLDRVPASGRDALRGLLDPALPSAVSGSRSWNWALLLSAGGTLSILDDDTCLPLRWPDDGDLAWDLADASEAGVRFFDDEGHLAARELDSEPFGWLGGFLGRAAPGLLRRERREQALRGRTAAEFLHVSAGAPVVGVVPGLYGGLALDTSAYALASNSYTMASLWRPPFAPRRLEADRVWHAYPHPRLASHATYTPLLLDARAPLPFAGTWGRVDDQYFLMLLRAIAGPVAFAHVPAMLGHLDLAPRQRAANARLPLPVDPNLFLAHLFGRWSDLLAAGQRWDRLHALAALAAEWAAAPDAALGDAWIGFRRTMRQRVVERTAALLDDPAAPTAWREVALAAVGANREAIIGDAATSAERDALRRGLRQLAQATPAWRAAWEACATDAALRESLAIAVPR
jgi:hypothetical protein